MKGIVSNIMAILFVIILSPTDICIAVEHSLGLPTPGEVLDKAKDLGQEALQKMINPIKLALQHLFDELQQRIDQSANTTINTLQGLIDLSVADSKNIEKILQELRVELTTNKPTATKPFFIPDNARYNQISWLATHNATSVGINLNDLIAKMQNSAEMRITSPQQVLSLLLNVVQLSKFGFNPTADQLYSFEQQVSNGIRAFKIPIHATGPDQKAVIMHTMSFYDQTPFDGYIKEYATKISEQIDSYSKEIDKHISEYTKELDKQINSVLSANNLIAQAARDIKQFFLEKIRSLATNLTDKVPTSLSPFISSSIDQISVRLKTVILSNVDQAPLSLESFLQKITSFLEHNPNEIVTILSDEHLPGRELGDKRTLAEQGVINAFLKSGAYTYIHIQKNDEPWPTVQELRKRNKRLVVFYDGGFSEKLLEQYPWVYGLHYTNRFTATTHWTHESLDEFMRADSQVSTIVHQSEGEIIPAAIVYIMYYFITPKLLESLPGIAGSAFFAQIVHQSENFQRKIDHFKRNVGTKPTIIMVDFYDHGFDNLVDVVNKLNQVEKDQKK